MVIVLYLSRYSSVDLDDLLYDWPVAYVYRLSKWLLYCSWAVIAQSISTRAIISGILYANLGTAIDLNAVILLLKMAVNYNESMTVCKTIFKMSAINWRTIKSMSEWISGFPGKKHILVIITMVLIGYYFSEGFWNLLYPNLHCSQMHKKHLNWMSPSAGHMYCTVNEGLTV